MEKFSYWTKKETMKLFGTDGNIEEKELSSIVYSGEFNPQLLKNLSLGAVNLINSLKDKTCTAVDGSKSFKIKVLTKKNLHSIALTIREGRNEVIMWGERHHHKSGMGRNKTYYDDMTYNFYLKPKSERLHVRKSTHTFDFKNRLDTSNLELLMTISITDEKGY